MICVVRSVVTRVGHSNCDVNDWVSVMGRPGKDEMGIATGEFLKVDDISNGFNNFSSLSFTTWQFPRKD